MYICTTRGEYWPLDSCTATKASENTIPVSEIIAVTMESNELRAPDDVPLNMKGAVISGKVSLKVVSAKASPTAATENTTGTNQNWECGPVGMRCLRCELMVVRLPLRRCAEPVTAPAPRWSDAWRDTNANAHGGFRYALTRRIQCRTAS